MSVPAHISMAVNCYVCRCYSVLVAACICVWYGCRVSEHRLRMCAQQLPLGKAAFSIPAAPLGVCSLTYCTKSF